MEIVISPIAQDHIKYWKKTNNIKVQKRIIDLKNAILMDPYKGIGKPEALRYELNGKWSRRIDKENRFVYAIEGDTLLIFSLKGHY
jgi:toxin YoeB